ncbi:hypothetical protein [Flavobacterium piscisymbiosum]|uniref:Uncharacterized protein n=1 Tax=Flavobacterium piscisymbiosum TaxID=2893753 RepID=A0ABS8MDU9_9FLAO|nr:hypothetical protein [Flavobacterium sp. F-30]MCC9063677.1 hypothetical protein [Flavobacterium sp. F-30]
MAIKHSTGRFQVCRNKTGIAKSTEILLTGDKKEIDKFWNELIREKDFTYYMTEEVFYSGTQKDAFGMPIDSTPEFQRL